MYLRESYLLCHSFLMKLAKYSNWLLLQPLNIPKQLDASRCGTHAILNIQFLLQLGDTYNQVDIMNLRIWFANRALKVDPRVRLPDGF